MRHQSEKDFPEKKQPEISVVIPLYNKEATVARAIQSVINQTAGAFEIIIVNDGSTDKGPRIVSSFKDSRIRLINQKNQGVSAARNRGIAEARNELIAFLDGDDEWLPGFLKKIRQLVKNYPQCSVYATRYLFGMPDGRTRPCLIRGLEEEFSGVLENYFAIAARSDPPIHSSAVVIRKNAINAVGGFPRGIKSGEDLLTWARLACFGKVVYEMKPAATFWLDPAHIYQGKPIRVPDPGDPVGKALIRLLAEYSASNVRHLKHYIALWHKMRASTYLRNGMKILSLKEIALSAKFRFQSKLVLYFFCLYVPTSVVNQLFRCKVKTFINQPKEGR